MAFKIIHDHTVSTRYNPIHTQTMMNSHPQLVLLSTFASNMTNRIMVDFIQKYLVSDPTLRKKSRYPTVVSLLQLLIIIMPGIADPSSEGKEPLDHFIWPIEHITTTSVDDDQTASHPPQLSLRLYGSFVTHRWMILAQSWKARTHSNKLNLKATAATRGQRAAYLCCLLLCSCRGKWKGRRFLFAFFFGVLRISATEPPTKTGTVAKTGTVRKMKLI